MFEVAAKDMILLMDADRMYQRPPTLIAQMDRLC